MAYSQIEQIIRQAFADILSREGLSQQLTSPGSDERLLDTGLDSMGFAELVVELEDRLGYDPFSSSKSPMYPQTFGEFVRFYEDNNPK